MLLSLTNTPRDYAWGSTTAIAALQGREASGRPEAELWLGAHPGSPAIVDGGQTLDAWLVARGESLPYLLKVLAAAAPLSLQAHPSLQQAAEGFARENALGLPLDADDRNYRDHQHKPELIVALSEQFAALCGFRPLDATLRLLADLQTPTDAAARAISQLEGILRGEAAGQGADTDADADAAALRKAVRWLLADATPDVIAGLEAAIGATATATAPEAAALQSEFAPALRNASALAARYPGDHGVPVALLMNYVELRAGEALYLPAGNMHAYMSGLGIELMAASDNVLRGGFTSKHVDVDELLRVLDTHTLAQPLLLPLPGSRREIEVFAPGVREFELVRVRAETDAVGVAVRGTAIAIATAGELRIAGHSGVSRLRAGESLLITADEHEVHITGPGELFIAHPGA